MIGKSRADGQTLLQGLASAELSPSVEPVERFVTCQPDSLACKAPVVSDV